MILSITEFSATATKVNNLSNKETPCLLNTVLLKEKMWQCNRKGIMNLSCTLLESTTVDLLWIWHMIWKAEVDPPKKTRRIHNNKYNKGQWKDIWPKYLRATRLTEIELPPKWTCTCNYVELILSTEPGSGRSEYLKIFETVEGAFWQNGQRKQSTEVIASVFKDEWIPFFIINQI